MNANNNINYLQLNVKYDNLMQDQCDNNKPPELCVMETVDVDPNKTLVINYNEQTLDITLTENESEYKSCIIKI